MIENYVCDGDRSLEIGTKVGFVEPECHGSNRPFDPLEVLPLPETGDSGHGRRDNAAHISSVAGVASGQTAESH